MLDQLRDHLPLLQYAHLLWGVALFIALAFWAYWPSRKSKMQDYGARILNDDDQSNSKSAPRGHHVAKH